MGSFLLLILASVGVSLFSFASTQGNAQCDELGKEHYCYRATNGIVNYTKMPNSFDFHDLAAAKENFSRIGFDTHPFNCSSSVDIFICSLYFPICHVHGTEGGGGNIQVLKPCREFCIEVAENACRKEFAEGAKILAMHGLTAPTINCSILPTFSEVQGGCLSSEPSPPTPPTTTPLVPANLACHERCNSGLVSVRGSQFGGIENCCEPCMTGNTSDGRPLDGVFTTPEEKVFVRAWIGIISISCLCVTTFTVLNWLVSYRSYHYPETPILHVAICYVFIAFGYFIHVCIGQEIVCFKAESGVDAIADGPNTPPMCILTFFLIYFFSVASWVWWIVTVVLWFLQAAIRVNKSTIEQRYFQVSYHLVAWLVAAIFTIVAMATNSYGGNSITRMCQISIQSDEAQIGFLLAPQLLCIFVCIVLLLFGHMWLLICDANKGLKNIQKRNNNNTNVATKERSMFEIIRTDVFCVFFLIHMTVLSSINMYQFQSQNKWERSYTQCTVCGECDSVEDTRPLIGVFIFQVTVELVMGIVLVFWLKPKQVLKAWKKVYLRLRGTKSEESETPPEPQTPSTPTTPTWSPTSV